MINIISYSSQNFLLNLLKIIEFTVRPIHIKQPYIVVCNTIKKINCITD